jgi:hypothetical protein
VFPDLQNVCIKTKKAKVEYVGSSPSFIYEKFSLGGTPQGNTGTPLSLFRFTSTLERLKLDHTEKKLSKPVR